MQACCLLGPTKCELYQFSDTTTFQTPLLNFGSAQENTLVMGDEFGGFYSAANQQQKQPRIVYSNLA